MYAFLFDRKSVTLTIALFLALLASLFWAGLALGSWVGPELAKRTTGVSAEPELTTTRLAIVPSSVAPSSSPASAAEAAHETPPTPEPVVSPPAPAPPDQAAGHQTSTDNAVPDDTATGGAQQAEPEPVEARPSDTKSLPAPSTPPPTIVSRLPVESPATLPSFGKVAPATGIETKGSPSATTAPSRSDTSSAAQDPPRANLPGEIPAAIQSASDLVRPAGQRVATPSSQAGQQPATDTVTTTVYSVQVGTFPRVAGASKMIERLTRSGYEPYLQPAKTPRGRDVHTVRIGHFATKREALDAAADFAAREGTPAVVRWQDRP